MDVLNIISWIKSKRIFTTVDPATSIISIAVKDEKRDDGYLIGAMTVEDLLSGATPNFTNGNTPYGTDALSVNTNYDNTAIGYHAAKLSVNGYQSVFVGKLAGRRNEGDGNVGIGTETMSQDTVTGIRNTAVGTYALNSLTSGEYNVAIGTAALTYTTTGNNNIALGNQAIGNNTTGIDNIGIGRTVLLANTTGIYNIAIGAQAMNQNINGSFNTAVGSSALQSNTSGGTNTAVGANTSSGNFNGSTILGYEAAATGNNQFVVGSASINAGSVTTEVNTSSKVWNVVINGVSRKILLA